MIPVFYHPDQYKHNPLYEWDKRGHVPHPETSKRLDAILRVLKEHPQYQFKRPKTIPTKTIEAVHHAPLLELYQLSSQLNDGEFFSPTSFPANTKATPLHPKRLQETGFFCEDTSTPFSNELISAIYGSAASAVAGAKAIQKNEPLAYALCRPPGHHASAGYFGGYCYLNNAAIAAEYLSQQGSKVCILDIDYHHGDGTQSIFYSRNDVLTVSLHADPSDKFPFFTGFSHEIGQGDGERYNLNICLPKRIQVDGYLAALQHHALPKIDAFSPEYLIIAFGADTYLGDPICDFLLDIFDYTLIGQALAELNLPTLVIQEGGYCKGAIGEIVHHFLQGLS